MGDLRERRLGAGLTQEALAARSGIAQPNIAAYESGRRRPSEVSQQKLDAALLPRPSEALARNRDAMVRILTAHGMTNPRVFGSAATGTDSPGSDLDLLADASPELDLLDIVDAAAALGALLQVPVEIVTSRSLRPGHEIADSAIPV
ncbi:MAG: helix-turn-helix domain-containing protein [bacterium]|nr:helix-turn-helix domain-containing protein [bacterium]